MQDARSVASCFIEAAANGGHGPLTPMQLLKLSYIAHGYSLGLRSTPLIRNRIEAWKFGPVIPDLYHTLKLHRDQPVQRIPRYPSDDLEDDEKILVNAIFDAYGDLSGLALSNLTHKGGTPWAKVYQPNIHGIAISNDLIEEHYKEIVS